MKELIIYGGVGVLFETYFNSTTHRNSNLLHIKNKTFINKCVLHNSMKHIRLVLEDKEYEQLIKDKGNMTWKQYLMRGIIC